MDWRGEWIVYCCRADAQHDGRCGEDLRRRDRRCATNRSAGRAHRATILGLESPPAFRPRLGRSGWQPTSSCWPPASDTSQVPGSCEATSKRCNELVVDPFLGTVFRPTYRGFVVVLLPFSYFNHVFIGSRTEAGAASRDAVADHRRLPRTGFQMRVDGIPSLALRTSSAPPRSSVTIVA